MKIEDIVLCDGMVKENGAMVWKFWIGKKGQYERGNQG